MRPINGARRMAVFHRVVMDVIDVRPEIGVVADKVFPEPRLPGTALAHAEASRESLLQILDKPRIVVFSVAHPNQRMQVVWQHHVRNHIMWNAVSSGAPRISKPSGFANQ